MAVPTTIMIGHALGDALGAPFEFTSPKKYVGDFSVAPTIRSRWQGAKTAVCGQWTDDTEMSLCLYSSLLKNNMRYVRDDVIMSYMEWANTKPFGMGKNTRYLFAGIKTLRGYKNRVAKLDTEITQSNGCLMRAWPLMFAECDPADDATITNPNDVCVSAVRYYVALLRSIVDGKKMCVSANLPECVRQAIDDGTHNKPRDITVNKGWVAHALYCAVLATHESIGTYIDGIDTIIRLGGDTDTNAAIAGAILAARFPTFLDDEDRAKTLAAQMIAVDTLRGGAPRPDCYHPKTYVLSQAE